MSLTRVERDRARRLAKKQASVDAVRGDASVLLDALLRGRSDLEAEFDLAPFRLLAARKYALLRNSRLPTYGSHWVSRREYHDLYCTYCGYLIVTIRRGYWSLLDIAERTLLLERHTMICALQMLAGLRDPVARGTTLQDPSHEMLFSMSPRMYIPPKLSKVCAECEAPSGMPCVGTSVSIGTNGKESRLRRRKRPHDVRLGSRSSTDRAS